MLIYRPAFNVLLRDATFPPSDFQVVSGMPEVKWDKIASGANVTHALVLMPLKPGYFNFSSADVTYKASVTAEEVQVKPVVHLSYRTRSMPSEVCHILS